MEFIFKDTSNLTEKELIELLNHNVRCASITRREIEKLKEATKSSNSKVNVVTTIEKPIIETRETEDKVFEGKVRKCLKELKELSLEDIEETIYEVLPSHRDYSYEKIIRRVILELKKEVNDIDEIVVAEMDTISKEDLEELSTDIKTNDKRINVLKNVLNEEKEEDVDDNIDNTLIFIPTSSGNPRLLDDLKSIPFDYYEEFTELFMSIKDGSFKRYRKFTNNPRLRNLREVKGNKVRITFVKLGKNTYGILTAFLKKVDVSNGYLSMLSKRYTDYKSNVADKIKDKIHDEEFLELHRNYEIEILRELGIEEEKEIEKVKKGNE